MYGMGKGSVARKLNITVDGAGMTAHVQLLLKKQASNSFIYNASWEFLRL